MRRFSLELMVMAGVPVMEPSQSPIMLTISSERGAQVHEDDDVLGSVPFSSGVNAHTSRRMTSLCSSVSATFTMTF